jgi:hypothetical protein
MLDWRSRKLELLAVEYAANIVWTRGREGSLDRSKSSKALFWHDRHITTSSVEREKAHHTLYVEAWRVISVGSHDILPNKAIQTRNITDKARKATKSLEHALSLAAGERKFKAHEQKTKRASMNKLEQWEPEKTEEGHSPTSTSALPTFHIPGFSVRWRNHPPRRAGSMSQSTRSIESSRVWGGLGRKADLIGSSFLRFSQSHCFEQSPLLRLCRDPIRVEAQILPANSFAELGRGNPTGALISTSAHQSYCMTPRSMGPLWLARTIEMAIPIAYLCN